MLIWGRNFRLKLGSQRQGKVWAEGGRGRALEIRPGQIYVRIIVHHLIGTLERLAMIDPRALWVFVDGWRRIR